MDAFTVIARGDAPALAAAWEAMSHVLDDQQWHSSDELADATRKRIPPATARNLIADAALTGRIEVHGTGRDVMFRVADPSERPHPPATRRRPPQARGLHGARSR